MNRLLWLSPAGLVITSWLIVIIGSAAGVLLIESLPVLRRALNNDNVDLTFNGPGFLWLSICLILFVVLSAYLTKPITGNRPAPYWSSDLMLAARIALAVQILFSTMILLWFVLFLKEIGGASSLMELLTSRDIYLARDVLLENKLFTGMRLFYSGLVGLGTIGAGIVAHNHRSGERSRTQLRIGWYIFLVSFFILASMSIILSQRLLAFQLLLGATITASIILGRLFFAKWLPFIAITLFTIWSAREFVTVGVWDPEASAYRLGFERLLFYLMNDLYNAVTPVSDNAPHTWGYYTFRFIIFFTQSEDYFRSVLAEQFERIGEFKGGGAFPIFTATFVDFSYFGIILVGTLAVVFAFIFNRAQKSFVYACIYGQIGAALFLSVHVSFMFEHDFIFNLLLTSLIGSCIPQRTCRASAS